MFLRRMRKGISQVELAEEKGISLYAVRKQEANEEGTITRKVNRYEELVLLRRRLSDVTVDGLAAMMTWCPYWYRIQERKGNSAIKELLCKLIRNSQ